MIPFSCKGIFLKLWSKVLQIFLLHVFSLYFRSLNLKYLKLTKMELTRFAMKLFTFCGMMLPTIHYVYAITCNTCHAFYSTAQPWYLKVMTFLLPVALTYEEKLIKSRISAPPTLTKNINKINPTLSFISWAFLRCQPNTYGQEENSQSDVLHCCFEFGILMVGHDVMHFEDPLPPPAQCFSKCIALPVITCMPIEVTNSPLANVDYELPFKLILRRFAVVFLCLKWECCTFQKTDENSFKFMQSECHD